MNTYRLIHRVTNEQQVVQAESAQEAAEKVGWMIGDCFVRDITSQAARDNAIDYTPPRRRGAERMYGR